MSEQVKALLASFFLIAVATTLVLPGRATPTAIRAFFESMAGAVRATLGSSTRNTNHNQTGGRPALYV